MDAILREEVRTRSVRLMKFALDIFAFINRYIAR
jgi:hypothetical protein